MRVLVTGGKGFIGSSFVVELKGRGFEVREFDLALGSDLLNENQCIDATRDIDIVFHLAAIIDETNPAMQRINVQGTKNILEASAKAHVKQFVFLSTVGVHGKAKGIISETSLIMPETKYEQSKADAEKLVLDCQEMMHITVLRSALVMGPSKEWKSIIKMIESEKPLPGKGENHFQTIYIKDLVSALLFVANNKNCFGETFIVAGAEKPTLKDLVEMIRKKLGMRGEARSVPIWLAKTGAGLNMIKNRLASKKSFFEPAYINRILHERNYATSKINLIGWAPKYSVEKAIEETIAELKRE